MFRLLFVTLIAAIFIYLALIFESTGFALLSFVAVTFAVLSFLYLFFQRKRVRIRLMIPMKVTDRGQSFTIRMEIQNKTLFPLGKLCLKIAYGENSTRKRRTHRILLENVPKGKSTEVRKLEIALAGYYEFSVKWVRIYDLFGLFYVTRRGKDAAKIMILPKIEEVPLRLGESVRHFYGETLNYDADEPGSDPSEVFGFREFRDGDKLQRIHWKLSARMDELMVKEDALPKACAIVLIMPEGNLSERKSLDYVASLSFTLMDGKCPHYVAWQSASTGDVRRIRVDDEESFYVALTVWLQDHSLQETEDLLDRYQEKYRGENYLHVLRVTRDEQLIIDNEPPISILDMQEELYLK
ncbi:MAG: DUF58 domain-containing protein [Lachnospiraceae bacterium]|nr:DUF58 domain-containing protein [Lachnospiraceae bacterium]